MSIPESSSRMIDTIVIFDAFGFTNTRGFLRSLLVRVSLHARSQMEASKIAILLRVEGDG